MCVDEPRLASACFVPGRCPSIFCVPKPDRVRTVRHTLVLVWPRRIGARRSARRSLSLSLSLIFSCSGLQPQASHSASSAPDHAHHAPAGGTSGELASEDSQDRPMGAPKDDKPTGSPTVVELETVVMSSITCAISYLILHLDNFTMRDIRAPIGAVKHHGLSCAELIVSSHGATASPVMATNPSSEGGVRLDQTASVDGSDIRPPGAFTFCGSGAPIGAVKHHGLSCAELIVNSHGATASPVMATNPSSEGGVRLDQTASVDGSDIRSLGASIFRGSGAPAGAVEHHDVFCAELVVNSHGAVASPAMTTHPPGGAPAMMKQTISVNKSSTSRSLGPPIASGVADVVKYDSVNVTELASALAGLRVAAAARPIFEGPSRKGLELRQRCTA